MTKKPKSFFVQHYTEMHKLLKRKLTSTEVDYLLGKEWLPVLDYQKTATAFYIKSLYKLM